MQVQDAPVILPIIHLNGDRPETLVAELSTAYHALIAALAALQQCAPNARNYYPQDGLYVQACAQHQARVDAITAVRASLVAEAQGIQALTQ